MTLPLPSVFNSQLQVERLQIVSDWLLDELFATEDDLTRSTDSRYTRSCTTFGRQRNRIIAEVISGKHSWLGLPNSNNDLVLSIGGVPCRFSNDDPANPTKDAVLTTNSYQLEFLELTPKGEPGRFCFIIHRGQDSAEDPRVEFVGFTPSGKIACRWVSNTVRTLRLEVRQQLAESVPVAKPQVGPKRRDKDDAVSEAV